MDIELEKQIESLERLRDKALQLRNSPKAREYQHMIDELAKKSRNNKRKIS